MRAAFRYGPSFILKCATGGEVSFCKVPVLQHRTRRDMYVNTLQSNDIGDGHTFRLNTGLGLHNGVMFYFWSSVTGHSQGRLRFATK